MQENFNTTPPLQENPNKKKKLLTLLAVLLILALVTSWLAGYLLGKNTAPVPSGQVIDTILLAPEDKAEQAVYLTGKIVKSDGTPYADGRVQLHSELKETVTDSNGRFSFFNVDKGRHVVSVVDEDGNVLAQSQIDLSETPENTGVTINKKGNGSYTVKIAADVRLMEVVIELDRESGILIMNPERLTYVTSGGRVVTPTGEASYLDGTIVTPIGTIVTTDGTIITPNGEGPMGIAVITADDELSYPDRRTSLTDGTVITDQGVVMLVNGSTVTTKEEIVISTSDGNIITPGEGGVIIADGNTVKPIGQEPDQESNQGEDTETKPSATPSTGGNQNRHPSNSETPNTQRPETEKPDPERPDSEEPDTPDTEDLVEALPDFSVSWTQGAEIDLFANRKDGSSSKDDILPGSKGYYPFMLKNGNSFDIDFDLSIIEGSLHIPMRFRIVNADNGKDVLSDWWSTKGRDSSTSKTVRLYAGESRRYHLEWEWLYESGNDAADTNAGIDLKGIYTVELKICARQAVLN